MKTNQWTCVYETMLAGLAAVALVGLTGCGPIDDDGDDQGEPDLASCGEFETLEGSITEEMTLSSGDCFEVVGNLRVEEGGHLTIEPGTVLQFQENAGLAVWNDGKLTAAGEASSGILMTGVEPNRGYWRGVAFHGTNSTANQLEYVTIEYGGGEPHYRVEPANLTVDTRTGPVRLSVSNTTLRESNDVGFRAEGANENFNIDAFEQNTLTSNAEGAAAVLPNAWGALSATGTYSGNDTDVVFILSGDVTEDQSIAALDAAYQVTSSPRIENGAAVEIAAGAELRFEQDAGLSVWENASLAVAGTQESPVLFTGVEQTRGYWRGLAYHRTNSTSNRIEHATIEYGGGEPHYRVDPANLTIDARQGPVRLAVTNTTIRESNDVGFRAQGDNGNLNVDEFTGNTLTSNAEGAASVRPNAWGVFSDTSTYSGNDTDIVVIQSGDVTEAQSIDGIDAAYLVTSSPRIENGAAVEIAAGAELQFAQDAGLSVWDEASLTAEGTADRPILFTGVEKTKGYWRGLAFQGSNSTANILDHVIIEYAGGESHYRVESGSLVVDDRKGSVRLRLDNAQIRESASAGLMLDDEDRDHAAVVESCTNVTFSNVSPEMVTLNDSVAASCPYGG